MAEEKKATAYGWEDSIENDSSNELLPAGEGSFEVVDFQRGTSNKWNCPQAELKIKVTTPDGTTAIKENLPLCDKFEWKMCEFFRAIGQRKHGERFKPQWNKLVGSKGKCKINVREYEKDGEKKKINGIEKYIDPAPETQKQEEPSF